MGEQLNNQITGSSECRIIWDESSGVPTTFWPRAIPEKFYQATVPQRNSPTVDAQMAFQQTGRVYTEIEVENELEQELQILQNLTGLTWNQLAIVFHVQPRSIHYWRSGEKDISSQNIEILRSLLANLSSLRNAQSFHVRKYFVDEVLNSTRLLRKIQELDFSFLEQWIEKMNRMSNTYRALVSPERLAEKQPASAMNMLDIDIDDVKINYGKSRPIRSRHKIKPK